MPMEQFHERCAEVASRERRSIIIRNHDRLPDGQYGFFESYCNEAGCDCRRVFLTVLSPDHEGILATINYGWESRAFYRRWTSGPQDEEDLDELTGPVLAPMNPQSNLAPALLELFEEKVKDPEYMERLARHYRMFKEVVNREGEYPELVRGKRTPRNAPCPCGSGKKYKRCCM